MRVVVDTNIVISSAMSPNGKPAEIMNRIYSKNLMCYYSDKALEEYKRVLSYEKFKFPLKAQNEAIDAIIVAGKLINPPTSTIPLPDETDRTFYDTAKASGAILITGNLKHYPTERFIMTPADFLAIEN